jgi:hypothetical protein
VVVGLPSTALPASVPVFATAISAIGEYTNHCRVFCSYLGVIASRQNRELAYENCAMHGPQHLADPFVAQ